MSVTRKFKDVKVNGAPLTAVLGPELIAGSISLATDKVTTFTMTIVDRPELTMTTDVTRIFRDGTVIEWEEFTFAVTRLATGGGAEMPTIEVEATSDFVDELDQEKGESNWDTEDVSAWAKKTIEATGAKAVVQPGLGSRPIERKENEDNPEDGESTWDVMVNLAKQVGAWVYEYGDSIVFGKPTWLAAQGGVNVFKFVWNSWTDHSPGLLEAPAYTWDKETKPYEGKETLTLTVADPVKAGAGYNYNLAQLRPGNMVTLEGKGSPTDDPTWIVRSVEQPLVIGEPMTVLCWRPLDPPEVKDDAPGSGGSAGGSGVPDGPIGQGGWNGEQLKNASEIVGEAKRRGYANVAAEIAVMTAMQESSLRNLDHGDEIYGVTNPDGTLTTSVGLFQQQDPWGPRHVRMSPAKSAGLFYDRMVQYNWEQVRDGMAAGAIAQAVQGSAHPDAYAKHWNDAKLVVKACLEAGESAGGGLEAPGELGKKIARLMKSYEGQSIDVDGSYGAQCYDLAQKYLTDLTGIGMIQANGKDFWRHPDLLSHFTPVPAGNPPRKGDIASWRAYSFQGEGAEYGHVAIYAGKGNPGGDMYLSQNPGRSSTRWLPRAGIQGWMRPKAKGD